LLLGGLLENVLQVGGLATKARTVVHDFAVDLAGREVDKTQDFPQTADISTSSSPQNLWLDTQNSYTTRTAKQWDYSGY
jgi:hypothetical protein